MKSKFLKSSVMLLICICFMNEIYAQFKTDGEFRSRFEFRDGYKRFPDSLTTPNYVVGQRTRLNLNYKKDRITTKLSIQDVRAWGDEPMKTDIAGLGIYEAWGEFLLIDSLSFRAGRQEVIVDNERLLGLSNWTNKAVTHDAFVLKYKKGTWKVDFGSAFNQPSDTAKFGTSYFTNGTYKSLIGNYKTLNYLWLAKSIDSIKVSLIGIADGLQKRGTTNTLYVRETFGGIVNYKNNNFQTAIRGFYQMGKDSAGADIASYYLNAEVSYKVQKLNIKSGIEYISGNNGKDTLNKKLNTFSTLYGAAHAFNGYLDYIKDFPKQTKKAGLVDIFISLNYPIFEKLSIKCDAHYLALQNNLLKVKSTLTTWDKYLGTELDLVLKYDYSKEFGIQAGYSTIFGSKTLEFLVKGQNSKFVNWAWIMLTFKPKFFDSSVK